MLALAVAAPPGQAQADKAPAVATPAKFVFEQGQHELAQVVKSVGQFLGRTYLTHPTEMAPEGRLVGVPRRLEVDAAGCERVLGRLAMQWNFVAAPVDLANDVWEFVDMHGPRRSSVDRRALQMTPDEVLAARERCVWVMTVFTPQHVDALQLGQTLRPFFATTGFATLSLSTMPGGKIVMSGLAESVAGAVDLIRNTDQPQPLLKEAADRLAAMEKRIAQLEATIARLESTAKR